MHHTMKKQPFWEEFIAYKFILEWLNLRQWTTKTFPNKFRSFLQVGRKRKRVDDNKSVLEETITFPEEL